MMRLLLFCALASGKSSCSCLDSLKLLKFGLNPFFKKNLLSPVTKGEYPLIFDKRRYDIAFPCEEDYVCFHVWRLTTRVIDDDVAVVTNGNLQSAESGEVGSTCILPFNHYTDEDYYHACHKNSEDSYPYNSE